MCIRDSNKELIEAIEFVNRNGDSNVDNIRDWLLVSQLNFGGEPWAEVLTSQECDLGIIEISHAKGIKCERCWHYENDIGQDSDHPTLCGRCVDILSRI